MTMKIRYLKIFLLAMALCLGGVTAFGQETLTKPPKPEKQTETANDLNEQGVKEEDIQEKTLNSKKEEIFPSVDQMPQFPGGEGAMLKWIAEHLNYPAEAMEEGAQGRVMVQFVVTKDGSIGQVVVIRGRHPALDKEAIRVVKTLPKFIPGKMNGQAVNVWYTLPINFSLE